jgi:MarR family transcriptional regulator, organic hydroperoxide resistance regulator
MEIEPLVEDLLQLSRLIRPFRRADMTPEQYWLLRHLRCYGPQSLGELAGALGITTSSATVACKRLEKAGLLMRVRQTNDERIVHVSLTEQGQAQIDVWRRQKRESIAQLLSVLDQSEQEELQSLVERLLAAAESQGFGEARQHDSHH